LIIVESVEEVSYFVVIHYWLEWSNIYWWENGFWKIKSKYVNMRTFQIRTNLVVEAT